MTVKHVEYNFKRISYGSRETSCTDQLAIAIMKAYEKIKS